MALIVQKYGGASLSDVAKINKVARYIADLKSKGNQIVAVVSAMGYTTDELVRMAHYVARKPEKREMDMLLSVGERITMSLLAMAIEDTGIAKAISYTGSQVGIITDNQHTDARIVQIRSDRLNKALEDGKVIIVAGFQGVSLEREITTLGRGGSDTTAIALAAALKADRCDLIKEVPGIFTADPATVIGAHPIPEVDFRAAKGLSLGGARILKDECVALAEKYGIEIRVGDGAQFTLIKEKPEKPFFSMTLKEKLTVFKGLTSEDAERFTPPLPTLLSSGETMFAVTDASSPKLNIDEDNVETIEGAACLTAVGAGVQRIPQLIQTDADVKKVFGFYLFCGECRVWFLSDKPKKTLQRTHDKMLKE